MISGFPFKCLKNVYKLNVFDYVLFRSCTKPLRNVDNLTLDAPFSRTDVRICRLWNELPLSIRESNTVSIFLKNLMAFYYDKFNFTLYFTISFFHLWKFFIEFLFFISCLL